MTNEIIVVKQLPEIVEQLHTIKGEIERRVSDALALDCTEDTVKEVKAVRAALKKDFDTLESKRKEVKNKILSPYEQFEEIYKECVTSIFRPADGQLAGKIAEVENGLKEQKKTEILEYFEELRTAKGIDFVSFDDSGAVVTLTASKKSLKERVKVFLDKVSDDLSMIDTQDHKSEILVEYKRSLNVSQAILTVNNRHKAIEEERLQAEKAQLLREQQEKAEEKVDTVIQDSFFPPSETPLVDAVGNTVTINVIPAESVPEENVIVPDKTETIFTTSFNAWGTKPQLKALKEFMIKEGIRYEQL